MATPKKPPGYSFSALDLFDRCPWAYKLVRWKNPPGRIRTPEDRERFPQARRATIYPDW